MKSAVEMFQDLTDMKYEELKQAVDARELMVEEASQLMDAYKAELLTMNHEEMEEVYNMYAMFIQDGNLFIDEAYKIENDCMGWVKINKEVTKEEALEMYKQGYDTLAVRERGDYFSKDFAKNSFMDFFQITEEEECPFQNLRKRDRIRMESLECELKHTTLNGYKLAKKGNLESLAIAYVTGENIYKKGEMVKINYFYNCGLFTISIKRDEFSEWVPVESSTKIVDVKKILWSL